MAETFVARRDGPGGIQQHVCLKRVLPAFNGDKSFRDQFQREARLAARLRHSNIVGTIDYGSVDQVQYMALELVEGLDLRALLTHQPERRLPSELLVLIAFDIAHALEYAHQPREADEGIVHRDVTPSNILLSISGGVKLADFGVAKALGTATAMTATGIMKGKMPYMPPEQMKGGAIDGRVDLFSLGVLMYEALAGRRPFVGAHDVEVMTKIISDDKPPLLEVAPHVDPGLARVVDELLASEPADRVPNATHLIDLLTPFVPPPSARMALASLIREAYGSDAHAGAASDTQLAEAGELPLGSVPPTDAFAATAMVDTDAGDTDASSATARSFREPALQGRTERDLPRAARPTIREIQDSEPRTAPAPREPEPATQFGYGKAPDVPRDQDEADTFDDQPNMVPVDTLSGRIGLAQATGQAARAGSGPAHLGSANSGRYRLVGAAAFVLVGAVATGTVLTLGQGSGGEQVASVAGTAVAPFETPRSETARAEPAHFEAAHLEPRTAEHDEPSPPSGSRPAEPPTDSLSAPPLPRGAESPVGQGGGGTALADSQRVAGAQQDPASVPVQVAAVEPAAPPARVGSAERAPPASSTMTPAVPAIADVSADETPVPRANVRVTVVPWGDVWVDGNYMGRAPVTVRLPAGRHRIGAGSESPTRHQTIRVRGIRDRSIQIDLEAPSAME